MVIGALDSPEHRASIPSGPLYAAAAAAVGTGTAIANQQEGSNDASETKGNTIKRR